MDCATPLVSIVVPCRNERLHIEACLRSILHQVDLPGDMEVVVADGMSDDGSRDVIQRISSSDLRVRLVDNPAGVTPAGLNIAIRAARGEIIVRMDAHSEYAPDYVRNCLATLRRTGADNVGGPPQVKAESYVQRAVGAAFHSPFSTGGAGFHRPYYEGEVDTVHLGCWKRTTLLEIGLFDEQLIRNQDDDLNFRIKQIGGRLWQSPHIRSWYWPRASLVSLFKQYMQYGYWKVRVIQKHGRLASLRHLVPVTFVFAVTLGWLAGFLHPSLRWAYAIGLAAYGSVNVVSSVHTAAVASWKLLPILPAVYLVFHFSYGVGFAAGLANFFVLRRLRGSTASPTFQRTSTEPYCAKAA